jgi:hypothetical protein
MLPEPPVADDYREVIAAADELRRVLARFGSGSHARAPPIDPQLALVRDWAEVELSRGVTGGRPANELARTAVRDLLLLYWHGYGRKPSRALAGPTRRFVSAFFDGIRGKEVELVCAWRPGEGEELPPRRAVPCPAAGSIPDLIRETLPRLTSEPLLAWWGNLRLKTPTFSRLMRTRGKA